MLCACLDIVMNLFATTIAVVQAIFSCYLLIMVSLIVYYFGDAVDSVLKYIHILDIIVGTNVSQQIADVAGFFKVIGIGIFLSYFIICVLLCKGLCEHKPWMVLTYIVFGGIALGVRASLLTTNEVQNFQEDPNRSLFGCGGYGAYLLILFMICVDQLQEQRRQRKSGHKSSNV